MTQSEVLCSALILRYITAVLPVLLFGPQTKPVLFRRLDQATRRLDAVRKEYEPGYQTKGCQDLASEPRSSVWASMSPDISPRVVAMILMIQNRTVTSATLFRTEVEEDGEDMGTFAHCGHASLFDAGLGRSSSSILL